MVLTIFSVLGVVCAFLGLGVFLLSVISLLPVNLYNAIMSCIKLKDAIPLLNKKISIIPTLFFSGNILIALISLGLFYMITRKHQQRKNGKTDNNGGSTTSTTTNNQISNHNVFSHHQHSLMNPYTYAYVSAGYIWALIGSFLLYTLISTSPENNNGATVDDEQVMLVADAMRSQLNILWINLMVITVAACTMGISSLFFVLGRKKRHHEETRPLFSVV